jgi:hypothetical protein
MRVGFRARPCSLLAASAKGEKLYGNIKVAVCARPHTAAATKSSLATINTWFDLLDLDDYGTFGGKA